MMTSQPSILRALKGAIAIAALCLPMAAQAATQSYVISNPSQLVGQTSSCAANSYYNGCSSAVFPGFTWTDTIPAGSTINTVTVRFNDGVDCHGTGTVLQSRLNAVNGPTYTATNDCFCAPTPKIKTLSMPVGAYVVGGANTFLTVNPTTCLGNALTVIGSVSAYAVIDVDYTAGSGGGGGTGTCDLRPIEAKLDDGTRFTSDTERNNLLNGIVSEINQNEVKIDIVRTAVAALETKADAAVARAVLAERVDMERALGEDTNVNKPLAVYMLPSANGGKLEAVRTLVAQVIADANAAGCMTNGAAASLATGDAAYAASQWDEAYVAYSQAYKQASAGPCN